MIDRVTSLITEYWCRNLHHNNWTDWLALAKPKSFRRRHSSSKSLCWSLLTKFQQEHSLSLYGNLIPKTKTSSNINISISIFSPSLFWTFSFRPNSWATTSTSFFFIFFLSLIRWVSWDHQHCTSSCWRPFHLDGCLAKAGSFFFVGPVLMASLRYLLAFFCGQPFLRFASYLPLLCSQLFVLVIESW